MYTFATKGYRGNLGSGVMLDKLTLGHVGVKTSDLSPRELYLVFFLVIWFVPLYLSLHFVF